MSEGEVHPEAVCNMLYFPAADTNCTETEASGIMPDVCHECISGTVEMMSNSGLTRACMLCLQQLAWSWFDEWSAPNEILGSTTTEQANVLNHNSRTQFISIPPDTMSEDTTINSECRPNALTGIDVLADCITCSLPYACYELSEEISQATLSTMGS